MDVKDKQIKELKEEIKEDKEIQTRLMDKNIDLEKKNRIQHERFNITVQSLMIERMELISRIAKIDFRILGLGYNVKQVNRFVEEHALDGGELDSDTR